MTPLKYTREIIILGLAITVAILFFLRGCGGREKSDQSKIFAAKADSLQRVVNELEQENTKDHFRDSAQLIEAGKQTAAAKADVKAADQKLIESQANVRRLSALVLQPHSVNIKVDSANCDALAREAETLNLRIDAAREQAVEAGNLMAYEIDLRDSIIDREKNYSSGLKAAFTAQATVLKNAINTLRPRGRFLAGAGVLGNQNTFLSGAKIALAYQSKGGKQYQGEAMIVRGEAYYGGTVLITIFK